MTTEIPEITEERIREFAEAGGLNPEEVDTFLDSKCFLLQLKIPGLVAMDLVQGKKLTSKTCVVSCVSGGDGNIIIALWLPEPHKDWMMGEILQGFKAHEMEPPHQLFELEKMDRAMPGRDYIRSLLIGAARAGMEI